METEIDRLKTSNTSILLDTENYGKGDYFIEIINLKGYSVYVPEFIKL
ncbi:MAG: hypothetical protein MK105_00130 [Crocinitomicaceae bacterium]|nr:hypothetical protein [Crocinitomicaceae bacterium]